MNRTRLMAVATTAILAGGLAGCGVSSAKTTSTKTGAPKAVTITLGGWAAFPSNNVQSMQNFLKPFEKEYPWIHVKYEPVPGNYETELKTEYVAGDAADVVALNNGGQASPFIDAGDVIPLNHFLAASHETVKDFYSGTTSLFTYQHKLYAIPRDEDVLGLFYNKAMFAKAGIKSPPATWAQLETDAKRLTQPKAHVYGIGIDPSESYWEEFVLQAGGSIYNPSTNKMTLNTKAALSGFSYYIDLYRKGYAVQPSQVGATWSGESFGIGRVAMTIEGGWLISSLAQVAGGLLI
ncbi:MAG: extracellular solute-binding protein, partial [Firmicutes bacterium]|nr:extracellular solute-binding protein [Bacillota bacterium]